VAPVTPRRVAAGRRYPRWGHWPAAGRGQAVPAVGSLAGGAQRVAARGRPGAAGWARRYAPVEISASWARTASSAALMFSTELA
jgi:hypothetical protein